MTRQRVPKGKVFQKQDEKIINVITALDVNHSDDKLVEKFRELYSGDWDKIVKRYNDHEKITPEGKTHPMPPPRKYLLNKCRKYRELYRKGEAINKILDELSKPQLKFIEGIPNNIETLAKQSLDKTSYEKRIEAVNKLGKFKCEQSLNILIDLVENDKVFDVRAIAYDRLKRFGHEMQRPSKGKTYIDTDIQKKIASVKASLKAEFTLDKFIREFKEIYPEEYDLQLHDKKNQFKHWIKKQVENLPKT